MCFKVLLLPCAFSGVLLNYLKYCCLTHTSAGGTIRRIIFVSNGLKVKCFTVVFLDVLSVDRIKVQ